MESFQFNKLEVLQIHHNIGWHSRRNATEIVMKIMPSLFKDLELVEKNMWADAHNHGLL